MTSGLADFIRAEIEPILQAWEQFAKTILPAKHMDKAELRDHARGMLMAIADDLETFQSKSEQVAKSKGCESKEGGRVFGRRTWWQTTDRRFQHSGYSFRVSGSACERSVTLD